MTPHAEYSRRLGERAARAAELAARDRLLSNLRLAVFGLGAALALAIFFGRWLGLAWLAPPVVGTIVNRVKVYDDGGYLNDMLQTYETGELPPVPLIARLLWS